MGAGGTGGTCPARAKCTSRGYGGNPGSVRWPMTSRLTHYCALGSRNVTPRAEKFSQPAKPQVREVGRGGLAQCAEYVGLGTGAGAVPSVGAGRAGAKAEGTGAEAALR